MEMWEGPVLQVLDLQGSSAAQSGSLGTVPPPRWPVATSLAASGAALQSLLPPRALGVPADDSELTFPKALLHSSQRQERHPSLHPYTTLLCMLLRVEPELHTGRQALKSGLLTPPRPLTCVRTAPFHLLLYVTKETALLHWGGEGHSIGVGGAWLVSPLPSAPQKQQQSVLSTDTHSACRMAQAHPHTVARRPSQ